MKLNLRPVIWVVMQLAMVLDLSLRWCQGLNMVLSVFLMKQQRSKRNSFFTCRTSSLLPLPLPQKNQTTMGMGAARELYYHQSMAVTMATESVKVTKLNLISALEKMEEELLCTFKFCLMGHSISQPERIRMRVRAMYSWNLHTLVWLTHQVMLFIPPLQRVMVGVGGGTMLEKKSWSKTQGLDQMLKKKAVFFCYQTLLTYLRKSRQKKRAQNQNLLSPLQPSRAQVKATRKRQILVMLKIRLSLKKTKRRMLQLKQHQKILLKRMITSMVLCLLSKSLAL
mmetsp:Transcript_15565/g.21268  ORF Transcript_15565/g.21268 Transcript_15565/m.21268 type:complete len:282 (+) Transcript_15565:2241-3086(+)